MSDKKVCQRLDSNRGPLTSEEIALPTEPKPPIFYVDSHNFTEHAICEALRNYFKDDFQIISCIMIQTQQTIYLFGL